MRGATRVWCGMRSHPCERGFSLVPWNINSVFPLFALTSICPGNWKQKLTRLLLVGSSVMILAINWHIPLSRFRSYWLAPLSLYTSSDIVPSWKYRFKLLNLLVAFPQEFAMSFSKETFWLVLPRFRRRQNFTFSSFWLWCQSCEEKDMVRSCCKQFATYLAISPFAYNLMSLVP